MSSWRLGRRLGVASLVVLVLLGGAGVVVWTAFSNLADAQARVTDRLFAVVVDANRLSTALLDQETGVRGYALAGEDRFLDPYRSGLREEERAVADLDSRLLAESELRTEFEQVRAAVERWRVEYVEPTLRQVDADGPAAISNAELNAGKVLFDEVRLAQDEFADSVAEIRIDAIGDLNSSRQALAGALVVAAISVFVAICLLFVALRRWVLRPLDGIGSEALTVASGDLEHEVRVAGPPEFVALAADVDVMRRRLLGQYQEATEARRTLEEQRRVLAAQTTELQRSNTELEQFAYVASHDLQEPLRKVASFTQLLEQRYADQLDDRAKQYIEFAVDGSRRMQQLINDLLAFSRVGRTDRVFAPVALDDVLDTALAALSEVVAESGAVIERDPLPQVRGDATLLAQVFQNLVGNAIKFRREGQAPRIEVRCDAVGESWEISVADHGIGIDPQFAEKVFVIFQRLNRREEYEGTGIGLALCRKIIEFHGGRIWLRTDPVRDPASPADRAEPATIVSFTLPRADLEGAP